jgi:glycine/serine hydroxymethyltransferase
MPARSEEVSLMCHCPERHMHLREADPEIYALIQKQTRVESSTLKMIPSENFLSNMSNNQKII